MATPRRKQNARQQKIVNREKNRDNVMAIKATVGAVVAVVIIAIFIAIGGGSDPKTTTDDKPKNDDYAAHVAAMGGPTAQALSGERSSQPTLLAQKLLVAIGTEDRDTVDRLVSWSILFQKLADSNAWEDSRRWENQDETGRQALKDEWLFALLDPDIVESVQKHVLPRLEKDAFPANNEEINVDNGRLSYFVEDDRGKDLLALHIYSQLIPGNDPEIDRENPAAWRINRVTFEIRGTLGGKRKTKGKVDFGSEIGKPEKKKKAKRPRFSGPVEADVAPVAWSEGTDEATKQKIEATIREGLEAGGRAAVDQRERLVAMGKPAIPGLLNALAASNWRDKKEFGNVIFLVGTLEDITGEIRGVTGSIRLGGLTPPDTAVVERSLRRWFGWWTNFGPAWVRDEYDPSKETWEQFEDEEEDDG
ncbi:MAG: hypothetical protein R3F20_05685 [Planctomycetota bacterium]